MKPKVRKLKLPIAPPPKAVPQPMNRAPVLKVNRAPVLEPQKRMFEGKEVLSPNYDDGGGKDFTDILILIFDSGERVYHLDHRRNVMVQFGVHKVSTLENKLYELNGQKYTLRLDRASQIRWAPWKYWRITKPYWRNLLKPFAELTRAKKIGLLPFQELCNHKCSSCKDQNGEKCKTIPTIIEPLHISRIHQPSGRMIQ